MGLSLDAQGPVALRADGAIVVVGAAGATLVGPNGQRRSVRGERVAIESDPGLHLLIDRDERVIALTP